ncbi:S41 family peptidase [Devosia sp. SD17-2]|jgi:tricorn protease|uniref:S41 family peptidase n=1 Tax=Devosia sp. SD17-2 TaxID=2976459 RepID=UPI0023D7E72D|nr:S41 family peptidase [Devosia sp. SD17-2]WEJ33198.1 S41 family peptidase [Devosia sp. SD17-2]
MIARQIAASVTALMLAMTPALAQDETGPSSMGERSIWVRYPAIAPDGETLSFTYRGRIFVVDAAGGLAVPLTANGTYSHGAVWSADSEKLAFASDLNGDDDVYVTDFSGTLERLTWSAASEVPTSFSPDGKKILYTADRLGDAEQSVQTALSFRTQLYSVDTASGREALVLPNLALQAVWNRDKSQLAYTYNPTLDPDERQHRVAANARTIWSFDPVTGRHEPLFPVDGADRHNPVWSADGQSLYYLSEASGWLNVWQMDLASGTETQLTSFEGDPVLDLSVADNGTIAFANRGRIYVMAPGAAEATPIEVLTLEQRASRHDNFHADNKRGFTSSASGEHFAVLANADVFLQDAAGNFRQITATPGEETGVTFSPDGMMLAYAAQRDQKWGLYGVDLTPAEGQSGLAANYAEIALYVPEDGNAYQPAFSPDGTKIAFVSDRREIKVLDLASGDIITLFGESDYNSVYYDGDMSFAWSPGSKDLLVHWRSMGGSENKRVALVPADGSAPPRQIGNINSLEGLMWSPDGTQIIGHTGHYAPRNAQLQSGGADLYRAFISEKARQDFLDTVEGIDSGFDVDEEGNAVVRRYELDGFRSLKLEGRLTPAGFNAAALAPFDTQSILTVSYAGQATFLVNLISLVDGSSTTIGSFDAPGAQWIAIVPEIGVIDVMTEDSILRVPISAPDQASAIPSHLFYSRDPDAARAAAFEQAWADVKYRYYDARYEGRDWDAIGAKYRAYLGSIASDRELRELIGAMYGELSASHLFVRYNGQENQRADLGNNNDSIGVYLDHGYDGPGRRVAAILPNGPLDRQGIDIAPGDIISSINGRAVPDAGGLDRLLDLNVGRPALVGVTDAETAEERFYSVKPIGQSEETILARARLIDARREMVARLSNQCVAYQHVPAMDNPSYLELLANLNSRRGIARAALIDVRTNTGGNLTRELITLLSGVSYSTLGADGGPQDVEPNNRWVWPSAVVVDSFGYSDGSVFPQAYQDSKIGPLVGDVVLNTGTALSTTRSSLVPGLSHALPVLPNRRMDGTYYENNIIQPDIHVPFNPNNVGLNTDPQLEAAVAALMEQIGADSDCRP